MSKLKAGDVVVRTGGGYSGMKKGDTDTVVKFITADNVKPDEKTGLSLEKHGMGHDIGNFEIVSRAPIDDPDDSKPQDTAVTPAHYAFPGGIRVHQISGHLTSFGGQALQYIARSTRLDGQNKGDTAENLRKAIRFLKLEIARVEAAE